MQDDILIKRTTTSHQDFHLLIACLDHELWVELKEDQATYDPYNKVPAIKTAVIIYDNSEPVACGAFKRYNEDTVEIKRMFVQKTHRGRGLSKKLLQHLEQWAVEEGYRFAVLETSIHFRVAIQLYTSFGYQIIPNYPPYVGLSESVCLKKELPAGK